MQTTGVKNPPYDTFENETYKGFFVFEGIDGSGKTSLTQRLGEALISRKKSVHLTREPSSSPAGKLVQDLITHEQLPIDHSIFPFLFAADRYEHVYGKGGILEQLQQNDFVICDRYLFSSLVYQNAELMSPNTRQQSINPTFPLNKVYPLPELLFYLDIDVETAMHRLKKREKTILGTLESPSKLKEIRTRFALLRPFLEKTAPKVKFISLDAKASLEELVAKCMQQINI